MAKELLKEAIADAKAVREVALQNAKMALEEAFDSKIKNMLSAKLAEEIEEDVELEETYMEDEETSEAMSYDEDDKVDETYSEDGEEMDEEINLDDFMAELDEVSDEDDVEEGVTDKITGTAKGLAQSLVGFPKDVYAKLSKQLKDNPNLKDDDFFQAQMNTAKKFADMAGGAAATRNENVEEHFDIDALIAEIEEEAELEEGATGYDEKVGGKGRTGFDNKPGGKGGTGYDSKTVKKLKEERNEAIATVISLKGSISEMNLLNSKLLYCNKLFRSNSLTEAQKVKVVDALDMANTASEAKLVFSTLQESFNFTGVEKRAIKEGLGRASKASGNAPKKVITESVDETVSRFQKLANIKF
tara:strand:- start:62 stop:1138 length:1077 start_codon:yes stop_codon:yes gene_type:complete